MTLKQRLRRWLFTFVMERPPEEFWSHIAYSSDLVYAFKRVNELETMAAELHLGMITGAYQPGLLRGGILHRSTRFLFKVTKEVPK